MRHTVVVGAALMTAMLTVACGSPGETAGGAGGAASGADLYRQKCADCHGAGLEGTAKGPSHLAKVYEPSHHSDASFRAAIRNGSTQHHWNFGPMPAVPGLSDADITAIVAFVRAQQRERGFRG